MLGLGVINQTSMLRRSDVELLIDFSHFSSYKSDIKSCEKNVKLCIIYDYYDYTLVQ